MSEVDDLRKRLSDSAAGSPKVAPLPVRRAEMFKCTAGELRTAVSANADHPSAKILQNGVAGFPDDKEVAVERVDVEAILDDCEVTYKTVMETGKDGTLTSVSRKSVGGKRKQPTPAPTPGGGGGGKDKK